MAINTDLIILLGVCGFIAFSLMSIGLYWLIPTTQSNTSSWQALAEANKLSFAQTPTPHASGAYRGYHLSLNYQPGHRQQRGSVTRMSLFGPQSAKGYLTLKKEIPFSLQAAAMEMFTFVPLLGTLRGKIKACPGGQTIEYEQLGFENETGYLQSIFDLLCNLAEAYPVLVALGGEVMPTLQPIAAAKDHNLQGIAAALVYDIAQETTLRLHLSATRLLCPHCFVTCDAHSISLPEREVLTFYGCRACGQSRVFGERPAKIVAVLDQLSTEKQVQQDGILRVNWLIHRKLFDFDEVQIIQATDEEVERFAVQVGNDTDLLRKPRYKQLPCVVSPDCELSANSMKILQQMFGVTVLFDDKVEKNLVVQKDVPLPLEKASS